MLRDGRTINAAVSLEPEHLYSYRRNDGTTVHCLLSAKAERLLLQLIRDQAAVDAVDLSAPTGAFSPVGASAPLQDQPNPAADFTRLKIERTRLRMSGAERGGPLGRGDGLCLRV
jgi:hypothetical protein